MHATTQNEVQRLIDEARATRARWDLVGSTNTSAGLPVCCQNQSPRGSMRRGPGAPYFSRSKMMTSDDGPKGAPVRAQWAPARTPGSSSRLLSHLEMIMTNLTSRLTLIAAVMLFASGCIAGGPKRPCGLVRTVQDPFNGPTKEFTLYLDLTRTMGLGMERVKGAYKLNVAVVQPRIHHAVGAVGDKGEFRVGERIFTFENRKEATPISKIDPYLLTQSTQWIFEYELTKEEAHELVHALAQKPFWAMKIHMGGHAVQVMLDESQAVRVKNSIDCLLR